MRRSPCRDKSGVNKGLWSPEEDEILINYIQKNGRDVCWRALPKNAGLNRNGKSCRLRWTNYLRPGIKRGSFTPEEEQRILNLHANLGNQWSTIASRLPGRTDNEIKNYWNTHLKKKLSQMGFDPTTHRPQTDSSGTIPQLLALANLKDRVDQAVRLQSEATAKLQYLQTLFQSPPNYEDSSSFTLANKFSDDIEPLKLLNSITRSPESSVPSPVGSGSSSPHDSCFTFAELQRNAFETSNYLNKSDSSSNISHVFRQEDNSCVDFMWQLPPLYATGALVGNPTVEMRSNLSMEWPHFNDLGLSGTTGGLMS